jgi:hypothetical protein
MRACASLILPACLLTMQLTRAGDTVNVASRMESTGRADYVQLSAAAFRVAGLPLGSLPLFRLDVKGKGIMDTHLISAFDADTPGVRALLAAAMLPPPPPRAGNITPGAPAAAAAAAGAVFVPQPGDLGGVFSPRTPYEHRGSLSRGSHSLLSSAPDSRSSLEFLACSRGHMNDATLLSGSPLLLTPLATSTAGSEFSAKTRSMPFLLRASLPGVQSALAGAFFLLLLAATTPRSSLSAAAPLLLKAACLLALSMLAATRAARMAPFAPRSDVKASSSAAEIMSQLQVALALAHSEAYILRSGADAAMALFPGAVASAMGVFSEGVGSTAVSWLECGGDDAARRALAATLVATCATAEVDDDGSARPSSVARACRQDSGARAPLDSRQLPGGLDACCDWSASATLGGFNAAAAVTAKLVAGHVTVGFVQLYFGLFSGRAAPRAEASVLSQLADAVAGAIFVRRALAINPEYEAAVVASAAPSRRQSDPNYTPEAVDTAMEAVTARDDAALFAQLDERAAADHATLLTWAWDPWALPDAEVQRLMMAMMHSVGVLRRFQIRPTAFAAFVDEVAAHYADNPFHSFRHACKILHALFLFLSDLSVRNGLLEELDVLALLLAGICHDLEVRFGARARSRPMRSWHAGMLRARRAFTAGCRAQAHPIFCHAPARAPPSIRAQPTRFR